MPLGATGTVSVNRPEAGILTVVIDQVEMTLSHQVADKLLVAGVD
jgi:hypothetical protein